jgi:hypothetical protein
LCLILIKVQIFVQSWVLVTTPVILATQEADQEDLSSKPAQANRFARSYLKQKTITKRAGRVAQGVGPEFISQYHKK